jgi:hypothetical protein
VPILGDFWKFLQGLIERRGRPFPVAKQLLPPGAQESRHVRHEEPAIDNVRPDGLLQPGCRTRVRRAAHHGGAVRPNVHTTLRYFATSSPIPTRAESTP